MENRYTTKHPICPICKKPMTCDDIDYNFDGCQDNYWLCDCGAAAFNKVRYGKQLTFRFSFRGVNKHGK